MSKQPNRSITELAKYIRKQVVDDDTTMTQWAIDNDLNPSVVSNVINHGDAVIAAIVRTMGGEK